MKKGFIAEQIIKKLREAEVSLKPLIESRAGSIISRSHSSSHNMTPKDFDRMVLRVELDWQPKKYRNLIF
jgi:hypothetical protein